MVSSISTMSLQKPSFKSNLPDYLLQDASPRDRYVLENLSIIGQTHEWLVDETIKQSKQLGAVDEKVSFTNGKVKQALLQIKALEDKNAAQKETEVEIEKIVKFKQFFFKYLANRYAIICLAALSFGLFKIATIPELRELALKIIGF